MYFYSFSFSLFGFVWLFNILSTPKLSLLNNGSYARSEDKGALFVSAPTRQGQ